MPIAYGTSKYTFTRPGNTTAYGSSDLVANSVTPASVVPMKFSLQRFMGKCLITAGTLYTSTTTVTAANFLLNLFNASPTLAIGDNDVYSMASVRSELGTLAMDISTGGIIGTNDKKKRFAFSTSLIVDLEQVTPNAR